MITLTPQRRIANTAAVLDGPHGAVTRQAQRSGVSRQALYRDAPRVLHALEPAEPPETALQQENDRLRAELAALKKQHALAVRIDADTFAHFAALAQAEGVSLPVARRLLGVVLARPLSGPAQPTPSVARLGRLSRAAALQSARLLAVLDEAARPGAQQVAADEIFFGRQPCLMVVEQQSLCWLSGRRVARRDAQTWAEELRPLSCLQDIARDAGQGLHKAVAQLNAERRQHQQTPIAEQDDHFHVSRLGQRALRLQQRQVTRWLEKAEQAERRQRHKVRQQGSRQGFSSVVARFYQRAEKAMDAWVAVERVWRSVLDGLRLLTPDGAVNTRQRAEAVIAAALPQLTGPAWAKARRSLSSPTLLTFLDRVQEQRPRVTGAPEVVAAAWQLEALRRQPEVWRGEGVRAGALRGVLLVASVVLARSGEEGARALAEVRAILDRAWRSSSLVECINSVARMQQSRHRRLTQELLDLKRLYWNCRVFRTGRRRKRTPYELAGIQLPMRDWWGLLKQSPEQLRQHLSTQKVAA